MANASNSESKCHCVIVEDSLLIAMEALAPLFRYCTKLWNDYKRSPTNDVEAELILRAIVMMNGLAYWAWNARKSLVENMPDSKLPSMTKKELFISEMVLRSRFPKSDEAWQHRRWILRLQRRLGLQLDVVTEMALCA